MRPSEYVKRAEGDAQAGGALFNPVFALCGVLILFLALQAFLPLGSAVKIGWTSDIKIRYPMLGAVYDPTTHLPCRWRQYETLCNWHTQLLAFWMNNGYDLKSSIEQATQLAPALPSANQGPVPSTYQAPSGWIYYVNQPTRIGTSLGLFTPTTCLKLAGFGALRFSGDNSYNGTADWPYHH